MACNLYHSCSARRRQLSSSTSRAAATRVPEPPLYLTSPRTPPSRAPCLLLAPRRRGRNACIEAPPERTKSPWARFQSYCGWSLFIHSADDRNWMDLVSYTCIHEREHAEPEVHQTKATRKIAMSVEGAEGQI